MKVIKRYKRSMSPRAQSGSGIGSTNTTGGLHLFGRFGALARQAIEIKKCASPKPPVVREAVKSFGGAPGRRRLDLGL